MTDTYPTARQRSGTLTGTPSYQGLLHAGAGTALLLVQLGAVVPGFLPAVAITVVLAALVVLPVLVLGLVLGLLLAPPVGVWWAISRRRRRRDGLQPTPRLPNLEA
jgi:ABC-type sugar transport system permease subunit